MGAVSSGTGVVMPTLIPLAAELAASNANLNALVLMIGVVVGTNGVVMSQFSTVGALACGCAPEGIDINKLYRHLILAAVAFIAMTFVLSYIGFYNLFI